jgi:hypothetical protein
MHNMPWVSRWLYCAFLLLTKTSDLFIVKKKDISFNVDLRWIAMKNSHSLTALGVGDQGRRETIWITHKNNIFPYSMKIILTDINN